MPNQNNKNKGGRPKAEEKRSHHIAFRVNDSELLMMQEKMQKAAYKKHGPFIRDLIAGGNISAAKTQKRINQDFYVSLSRLGNNLNQVAKLLNSSSDQAQIDPSLFLNIQALLLELRKEIN